MKIKFAAFFLAIIQLLGMVFSGSITRRIAEDNSASMDTSERCAYRAELLSDSYMENFWFPVFNRLCMNPRSDSYASCWEYIGLISLTYKNALNDSKYEKYLDKIMDGLEYYRAEKDGKFAGYCVDRAIAKNKANGGVAYDDNMWLARDFINLYELTRDEKYLFAAVEIADFLISDAYTAVERQVLADYGFSLEDNAQYGGFYWDSRHDALHACSNAPAAQVLAALYSLTGEQKYLDYAQTSYRFLRLLENPDGIFYDLMALGKDDDNNIISVLGLDESYYSYNSGAAITAAVQLYKATGDSAYLEDAKRFGACADGFFAFDSGVPGVYAYRNDNVWFNLILLNGYVALSEFDGAADEYISHMLSSIDYAYDNFASKSSNPLAGIYIPFNWTEGWNDFPTDGMWALNVSASAEIYATLENYYS